MNKPLAVSSQHLALHAEQEERVSPGIWYVYEGETKMAITNEDFAKRIVSQNERIIALEAFVNKFLDNFQLCSHCGGQGWLRNDDDICRHCNGEGKEIISSGVLYVELPSDAQLLGMGGDK